MYIIYQCVRDNVCVPLCMCVCARVCARACVCARATVCVYTFEPNVYICLNLWTNMYVYVVVFFLVLFGARVYTSI